MTGALAITLGYLLLAPGTPDRSAASIPDSSRASPTALAPTSGGSPSAGEPPRSTAAGDRDDRGAPPAEAYDARGVAVNLGAGVGGCAQRFCRANPLMVVGRGSLGYRWPKLAVVGTFQGGTGPRTEQAGFLRTLGVDVGVELFPTGPGRVEPFVGVALGYSRVTETSRIVHVDPPSSRDLRVYTSRASARVSAGLPFRLSPRISMGPRFDYTWGFGGALCIDDGVEPWCSPIREIDSTIAGASDPVSLRAVRRTVFPRPWATTFELRLVF